MSGQFANTARQVYLALIQSPTIEEWLNNSEGLAEIAVRHAVSIESAIARHNSEMSKFAAEQTGLIPRGIHSIDPRDPDSWPDNGQLCRYAIQNPLSEPEDVPKWIIGLGRWFEEQRAWRDVDTGELVPIEALELHCANSTLVFRCAYWSGGAGLEDEMDELTFRVAMDSIDPF